MPKTTYLVLFEDAKSISVYESGIYGSKPGYKYHTIRSLSMQSFTDSQEAADFAAKHDGFIVIPATIKSEIIEVKHD